MVGQQNYVRDRKESDAELRVYFFAKHMMKGYCDQISGYKGCKDNHNRRGINWEVGGDLDWHFTAKTIRRSV